MPHEPLTEPVQGLSEEGGGGHEVDVRSCLSASAKGSQRLVLMAATNADVPTAMRKADEVAGLLTAGHKVVEVVRVSNRAGEKDEACEHERGLGRVALKTHALLKPVVSAQRNYQRPAG